MKNVLLATLAVGVALTAASAANAEGGCGRDAHRTPSGRCRPNGGPVGVGILPGLTIGTFYPGRGYWDGHRYYQHRERWHGGWRYR